MSEIYDNPQATDAELEAAVFAMLSQISADAAKAEDKEAPLREKARKLRFLGVDEYSRLPHGDGDRFAARFVDEVRCDATGKVREYYFVDQVNRWIKSQKGEITQRMRVLVDEVEAAARQALAQAAEETDSKTRDALKSRGTALRDVANRIGSRSGSVNAAANATDTYGMCIIARETFDQDRRVLACEDRLIVLNGPDVEVRPMTPEDYVTRNTGTRYVPERWANEIPEGMRTYFDTFMPDPAIQRAFFKIVGSSLIGFNTYRLLIIVLGTTTSGKGQLTDKIESVLGDYATVANSSIFRGNLDERPRADLLNVTSRRVAFLSEASKNWVLHVDRIKDMTGQTKITARALHSNDMQSEVPQVTPFLVTNNMPRINDADAALARRILVVPFNLTLPVDQEKTKVREAFMADRDVSEYLLYRMIEGYKQSAVEGMDDVKELFARDTQDALNDVSHVDEALDAMVEGEYLRKATDDETNTTADYQWITKKEVFTAYTEWVKAQPDRETRESALGRKNFNRELEQRPDWSTVSSAGLRWKGWLPGTKPVDTWLRGLVR